MGKRVLMIVTNIAEMEDGHKTGLWLSEFAEPYEEFIKSGFDVTVASIKGGKTPIDTRSTQNDELEKWDNLLPLLNHTVPLSQVNPEDFVGVFLPGGHGTMFDFPYDESLSLTLMHFGESRKVIGAVCHGPAGLVGANLNDGTPIVKGKRMTGFTDSEEMKTKLDQSVPFLLESKLKELGADFVAAEDYTDHVEADENLVTGQNPQSSKSVAIAMVGLLK